MATHTVRSASKRRQQLSGETDGAYLLKLTLYVIFGSLWLGFREPLSFFGLQIASLPVGLCVGLIFASHEHFQVDRKVEYAVLIVVAVISLVVGVEVTI
jgi:hypothetical protein